MEAAWKSDRGRVRPANEDFCFVKQYPGALLALVADGMGGYSGGEVASAMVAESMATVFDELYAKKTENCVDTSFPAAQQEPGVRPNGCEAGTIAEDVASSGHMSPKSMRVSEEQIIDCMDRALQLANRKIYDRSLHDPALCGMGTTLVALFLYDRVAYIANVGDSRAYYVKNRKIRQITQDHSLVGELLRNGSITSAQARVHPQKNIITRAVGTERNIEADYYSLRLGKGGVLVLCTDGLSNLVEDYEIADVVSKTDLSLEARARELIDLANEKDGYDNISVVLIG